ncbi:MAG: cytochrome c [Pseudomonadota bacterium]
MNHPMLVAVALAVCATSVLAHSGVKNPAVMARMHGMTLISDNVKVLGTMAKGQVAFDAASARAAAQAIADHAAQSVDLFAADETDPKSEALPAIWTDFDDFTIKAEALETAAADLAASVQSLEDVRAAMPKIGATCKACHSKYRE